MRSILFISLFVLLFISKNISAQEPEHIILSKDNTVVFDGPFTSQSTNEAFKKINNLKPSTFIEGIKDVYLVITSPGGSVEAGLLMIDNINTLSTVRVHTITIMSASMGFITAQLLKGKRYILPHGVMMSHRVSGGFQGDIDGNLDTRYKFYKRRLNKVNMKVVARTNGKHTLESYKNLIRDEYYCDGEDCIAEGFADNIANVECDKTLDGSETKTVSINFFGRTLSREVTKHNCPLIK